MRGSPGAKREGSESKVTRESVGEPTSKFGAVVAANAQLELRSADRGGESPGFGVYLPKLCIVIAYFSTMESAMRGLLTSFQRASHAKSHLPYIMAGLAASTAGSVAVFLTLRKTRESDDALRHASAPEAP